MKLFSDELVVFLNLFAGGVIDANQFREYLAERFFSDAPEEPLDRLLLGELEVMLAEFERGDRDLVNIQKSALELSNSAIMLTQQLGATIGQEAALALA